MFNDNNFPTSDNFRHPIELFSYLPGNVFHPPIPRLIIVMCSIMSVMLRLANRIVLSSRNILFQRPIELFSYLLGNIFHPFIPRLIVVICVVVLMHNLLHCDSTLMVAAVVHEAHCVWQQCQDDKQKKKEMWRYTSSS